jgi:hypothetical protein
MQRTAKIKKHLFTDAERAALRAKPARRPSCVWPPLMQVEEVTLPQWAFSFAFGAHAGAGEGVAAPVTPPLSLTGETFLPSPLTEQAS